MKAGISRTAESNTKRLAWWADQWEKFWLIRPGKRRPGYGEAIGSATNERSKDQPS